MQTQISIFNFESTKQVRTAIRDGGDIWFCLPDVANILAISNASPSRFNLSEAGVHKMYISYESGKKQVTFINEPNLYRVIFRSNKAEAVKFQNWVFDEVLPAIRKTGRYVAKSTVSDRTPLRQAVSMLVSRCGLDYGTAYTMVNQYMGTQHIDEIDLADLPRAIAYTHSLMIKPDAKEQGEFQITCHQATNQAMNYLHGLHAEIKRLGGVAPSLDIDEDEIARAIITRMVQGKRFMVNLDYWNTKPNVSIIDQKSWVVQSDDIAKIIADPAGVPKDVLPSIIQAALKRSGLTV